MKFQSLATLAVCGLLTACASKAPTTLYDWGNYPNFMYQSLATPDKADPAKQISKLEQDLQKTLAANRAVPPGFYAHLAQQYLHIGQKQKAVEYLSKEKQAYPESSAYIDSLLKRF